MKRIDVHSHLLPGVDDGCKSVDEAIACARTLVSAGYSHCFCTPHVWPNLPNQTRNNLKKWTGDLQTAMDAAGVPLKLLPGSELNLHPAVMETSVEQIISMGLGGKFILVDMWADRLPQWFEPTIRWLQEMGLTVILAHPERMRAVQDEPELAERFAEMNVLLQGNLQCFADHPDTAMRRTAERFILDGKYFLLGSDCHGVEGMKKRLTGLLNAVEVAGEQVVDQLTRENPRQLLSNERTI